MAGGECVTEHGDVIVAWLIFRCVENAPGLRRRAEHREEIGFDDCGGYRFGAIGPSERQGASAVDAHLVEHMVLCAPIDVIRGRDGEGGDPRKALGWRHVEEADEAAGLFEWQRLQQY